MGGEDTMTEVKEKSLNGNGKKWRATAIVSISAVTLLIVLLAWAWSGGTLKGASIKRLDQAEWRIKETEDRQNNFEEKIYKKLEKMSDDIWEIRVRLAVDE